MPPVEPAVPTDAFAGDPALDPTADPNAAAAGGAEAWRTQPGWVIQMDGHHFHNTDPSHEGAPFIVETFFKELETGKVSLPDGPNGAMIDVAIKDLGIHHPVVISDLRIAEVRYLPEATEDGMGGGEIMNNRMSTPRMDEEGGLPAAGMEKPPELWKLRRYDFRIQFCWQPQPRGKRQEMAQKDKEQESPQTAAAGEEATGAGDSTSG